MASIPNTRPGFAPQTAAPPGAPIVDAESFARTIALVPEELVADEDGEAPEIETPEIAPETVEATPQPDPALIAAIAPLLEAQVAAPPAPVPAPAAQAEAIAEVAGPVTPILVPPVAVKARKAPEAKTGIEIEIEIEAKPGPAGPAEKEAITAAKRAIDAAAEKAKAPQQGQPAPAPVLELRPASAAPDILIQQASAEPAPIRARETAAPTPERTLDLRREGEWLDRLARDIAQNAGNEGTIRFRLHPQTLGHIRVELTQGDHGTSIRVTTETEQARAIIADSQHRLAAEARAQGVRIAETHVDLSGSDRHASGDPRRQDDARQTPFVRTARAAAEDATAPDRPARTRSDRFA